ncbi:YbaK/EbsC family protein [Sphingobium limneticum]|jgi:prolyl-tRNA editing enzyme YbaK/EbsC (Cys-tRNA(Pro) deacylase)|uniref:YbaK/EbsC family protein n=1 Tax=Sphingobium limneticum TaxID=1007511 RepID=A0A5J5I999_9SPHN|nr:YbaK/EbsC family protein [Sphingobium limneticum]KAA9020800.1 YbaK/EbsC family protein [Sphingobium limneticum]KAA9033127.1 YbaK/EbsC family protein [Sphingobium limneticum]
MSEASVRAFFATHAPDVSLIDQGVSTATVADAAAALGVEPARIAKTLSLRIGDTVILVCARGDARLSNGKAKAALGAKPRMLGGHEVEELTGHPVGGVCPFGLPTPLPVYCDVSLRDFATVFPAAGSRTTSVELTPDRLAALTGATWADICTLPDAIAE